MDYQNKGILFHNDRKQPGSKQPDYRGKLNVDGIEHELAGWVREGSNGSFPSLTVKPADADQRRQPEGERFSRQHGMAA
ncbi:MAG: hypothetical protein ABSD31_13650 [Candidatus Binataceae bacterium]|jgi:hypothetical protein